MGWDKFQSDFINKMMDKRDFTTVERKKLKGWANSFGLFIWGIAKFIAMLYITNHIYERVGFEQTVLLMLLVLTFTLRSFIKSLKPLIE